MGRVRILQTRASTPRPRASPCWDNAQQESFWSTLKTESYHCYTFGTRIEAIAAVSSWIETV